MKINWDFRINTGFTFQSNKVLHLIIFSYFYYIYYPLSLLAYTL